MKKNTICSCSKRLDQIDANLIQLSKAIMHIENKFNNFRQIQLPEKCREFILDETMLLDEKGSKTFFYKSNIKNQLFSVEESLYKVYQSIKQLQNKVSSIDVIKKNISMQTRIMEYILTIIPELKQQKSSYDESGESIEIARVFKQSNNEPISKTANRFDKIEDLRKIENFQKSNETKYSAPKYKCDYFKPLIQQIASPFTKKQNSILEQKENWSRLLEYSIQSSQSPEQIDRSITQKPNKNV